MAARTAVDNIFTLNRDSYQLTGNCVGAGAANPTSVKGIGIASITRSALGKYTITLADKWAGLLDWSFNVVDSTGNNHFEFNVVTETVSSTKQVNITVFKAATATAPAVADLATTDTLKFRLLLANSLQKPQPF